MVTNPKLRLSDVVPEGNIVPELKSAKKDAAIKELVNALVAGGSIPKAKAREVTQAILDREKLGSTGIGRGIAVPHVKAPYVKEPVGALGKSPVGIDFASLDGALTHTVFVFVSPMEPGEKHVALMSRFVTLIRKPDFTSFLAQTNGQKALHDFLKEVDEW
jgi:mannitol/fructose-specific phosphotransferase system IIA component (Ntr-type)